jgi:indole-3-glycerol phosphate synthase
MSTPTKTEEPIIESLAQPLMPPKVYQSIGEFIADIKERQRATTIIGEVKPITPGNKIWNEELPRNLKDARMALLEAILPHVSIVSIHVDPAFGGSFQWLAEASKIAKAAKVEVLAKGFNPTIHHIYECFDQGASYTMTTGWHPTIVPKGVLGDWVEHHSLKASERLVQESLANTWHEPTTEEELLTSSAKRIIINSRDIRFGTQKRPHTVNSQMLVARNLPKCEKVIQASNVTCPKEVHRDADFVIIGSQLTRLYAKKKK